MIERKAFFDAVRRSPFAGALGPWQVEGMGRILDEWERRRLTDLRWLAYMLATTMWETARTMQPIAEYGKGKGRKYGVPEANGHTYYGRGYVQLTWLANYKKMSDLVEADLVNNPDLAMDPKIAAKVMFAGMLLGTFTGKKLSQYFGPGVSDWQGARRIINGTDKANEIAEIARKFYSALLGSKTNDIPVPDYELPPVGIPKAPPPFWLGALRSIFNAIFKRKG